MAYNMHYYCLCIDVINTASSGVIVTIMILSLTGHAMKAVEIVSTKCDIQSLITLSRQSCLSTKL